MASWVDTTAPKQLLSVSRIDPVAETAKYSAEVMSSAGSGLDEQGKSLLAEDLRSPCTEMFVATVYFRSTSARTPKARTTLHSRSRGKAVASYGDYPVAD